MVKFFVTVLFSFSLLAVRPVLAAEAVEHTVTFQGEGLVVAVPDIAVLSLTVSAKESSLNKAVDRQALKMSQLLGLLREQGVDKKRVKTLSMQYQPLYEYDSVRQKQNQVGYQAVQILAVEVVLIKASAILDAVGAAQLGDLNGISFQVSNADALREQAVNLAIKDAKDRAARRAVELGVALGAIVAYQENMPMRQGPQDRPMLGAARKMADAPPPEVPAGESEIRVTVSVTYKLQ